MRPLRATKLDSKAKLPTRKFMKDAGLDLYSLYEEHIPAFSSSIIRTGVTIEIPVNFVGLLKPKSKSDFLIGAGVIDSGYSGEVLVKIVNYTNNMIDISEGDAIAQLLIIPILTPPVIESSSTETSGTPSVRGATGGIVTQLHSKVESIE